MNPLPQSHQGDAGEALEAFMKSLRAYADERYCRGIRMAARDDRCLGWEEKVRHGLFGQVEHDAHAEMNRHMGAHYGIYEAIEAALSKLRVKGDEPARSGDAGAAKPSAPNGPDQPKSFVGLDEMEGKGS